MVTHALLRFIQTERSSGTAPASIVTLLKERGWKDVDIDAAFLALLEGGSTEAPRPQSGILAEFCEILCAVWHIYLSRWERFVTIGLFYGLSLFFIEVAFREWVTPVLPKLLSFMRAGDVEATFYYALPYLVLGAAMYAVIQLWYVATLYVLAFKKGDTPMERMHVGLQHVPAIFGIKFAIALLLMIVFTPVIITAFLTNNMLVAVVFGPLFIFAALFFWFLSSLALPAYFHGVPWKEAVLYSMNLVRKNIQPLAFFYGCFGVVLLVFFSLVNQAEIVVGALTLGLVVPIQTLFMVALYRRFVPQRATPSARPIERNTVRPEHHVEQKPTTKRPARTKRIPKAP